jgi:hypothetical protein
MVNHGLSGPALRQQFRTNIQPDVRSPANSAALRQNADLSKLIIPVDCRLRAAVRF